jgi:hypothetical protein
VALVRAPADLEQLGVAPEALDVVGADVAVAAEHLHGTAGHGRGHGPAVELDGVAVDAAAGAPQVHRARRGVDEGAARRVLGVALGDVALHLAEAVERLAEGAPLLRVAHHHLRAAPRDAQAHGREGEPAEGAGARAGAGASSGGQR